MEHKQDLGHKEPLYHQPTTEDDNNPSCNNTSLPTPTPTSTTPTLTPTPTMTTTMTLETGIEEQDVSFFHDFIAGGIAGSASVIVGHPMDTLKVRMQTSTGSSSVWSLATSYGGLPSLFRGMTAPLSTACVINAIIFSSYGWSSRLYDQYIAEDTPTIMWNNLTSTPAAIHDSSVKAFTCGSFAGLVQALVICPQEHVKCRLQIQHGKGSPDHMFTGPLQATRSIVQQYGMSGLYRGWCITCWREVPAFGAYFAFYDILKDRINAFFATQGQKRFQSQQQQQQSQSQPRRSTSNNDIMVMTIMSGEVVSTSSVDEIPPAIAHHNHTWISSALAGGLTGALTWAMVYPFDVIKTQIQTMPLTADASQRKIFAVTRNLIQHYGWRHLFRGLTVTCLRAFPVNGIIFPVYEYTLMHICALEY
jgi:solute carrier family 25 (mitochondrial carnitine/acylcarnitine transporter), member 20/29